MIDRAQAAEALGQVLHVEEDLARSGARVLGWRVRHLCAPWFECTGVFSVSIGNRFAP
jgi:hypothetical protein